jgi:Protein of unknown function (DUF1569)
MKNIFNQPDFDEMKGRIKLLTAANPKAWGKMTVEQMVVHCTVQLKLALGEITSKTQGPSFMRSAFGKWILLSTIPWPKGAGSATEMNVELNQFPYNGMENSKNELLDYIDKVKGATHFSPHPLFGQLSQKEWGRLIYKHIDHHLKQFRQ